MFQKPVEIFQKIVKSKVIWPLLATIAYVAGAGMSLFKASNMLDEGTSGPEMESVFISFVVWGLLIAGLGQFMMAASHGSDQAWKFWTDAVGKLAAVLGWSLGSVAGVLFAMNDTEADGNLIGVMTGFIFILPIAIWALIGIFCFVKWKRSK